MAQKAKTIVHVNQHVIKANRKTGERNPCLTVKQGRKNTYAHEAVIKFQGTEVARVVYRPHKPLSCGAQVWIETTNGEVIPITHNFHGCTNTLASALGQCPVA